MRLRLMFNGFSTNPSFGRSRCYLLFYEDKVRPTKKGNDTSVTIPLTCTIEEVIEFSTELLKYLKILILD
jgi:hypothetical protein